MRLWTIQPLAVWEILERDGVFHTDPALSEYKDEYPEGYDWIVRRLRQHAGREPDGCKLPIWAWYQWHGVARPKPDLRWFRHYGQGERVRIEVEVGEQEALRSDFILWHYCMGYWYLSASRKDDRQFSKEVRERGLDYFKTKPLPDPEYMRGSSRVGRESSTWIGAGRISIPSKRNGFKPSSGNCAASRSAT